MGENMFEKFNDMFDVEGLKQDVAAVASNTGDFEEVPHGNYEVKVSKIELTESKTGLPMAKVWFDIIAGEYKGQKIFCNQMLHKAFGIHKMKELLNSFETGIEVEFEGWEQFADLFKAIFNEIDGKAEFQLAYTANPKNKDFSDYTIVQRFTN